MRFTLLLAAIIFTGLVMYAKLQAIADSPPHIYSNGCRVSGDSSQPIGYADGGVERSN
jgi:hypothetical protein